MKRRYQIGILAILVLAAYYPAARAGASLIDDSTLLQSLERSTGWHLRDIFFPAASGGFYYRPLILLSYVFDREVLKLSPGMMHLENVLLHLMNCMLVYVLTAQVMKVEHGPERPHPHLPLVAGALFGLHPVNTESVNWISGRTDVLAATFILASAYFLLQYRERRSAYLMALSILSFLCGVLSKETSIAYFFGFALLLSVDSPAERMVQHPGQQKSWPVDWKRAFTAVTALLVLLFVLHFRSLAFTSSTNRIGITAHAMTADGIHSLLVVLRAFGFYMKKFIMPYPLNFAIREIDPLYDLLAVPLVVLCIYIALRRTVMSTVFLTGVFLIFPAFLLAFGQIAWTPYAERYVYISSAFLVIAAVVYGARFMTARQGAQMKFAVAALILVMFAATLGRSLLWQDDFALVRDTVEKSPQSRDLRVVYGAMLAARGDYDRALQELQAGSSIGILGAYDERVDLNRAFIAYRQGRIDDSIALYDEVLTRTDGRSVSALQNLVRLYEALKDDASSVSEMQRFESSIELYQERLYKVTGDPHLAYRIASNAAQHGQLQKARSFFQAAYDGMSFSDPYKVIVAKRISRLPATAYDGLRASND